MENKKYGTRTLRLINLRQVCEITSLGKTSIYQLIKKGEICPAKLGRKTVFSEIEILRWIEKQLAKRRDLESEVYE